MQRQFVKLLLLVSCLSACSQATSVPTSPSTNSTPAVTLSQVPTATEAPAQPTPTALPTLTAEALKYYPLTTKTNIPAIDDTLAVVAANDPQELIKRFGYTSLPCATVAALGGPPACSEGEADGTIVEVLPFLGSEGSFLRRSEADVFPGLIVEGVYAIFEVSDKAYSEVNYPAGEYGVVLTPKANAPFVILHIQADQIIRIDTVFDATSLSTIFKRDAARFILAPVSNG